MHKTACVWCLKLTWVEEPPGKGSDTVCSDECKQKELRFRRMHSDEQIGLRNFRDHGVNPNHRGKKK